MMLEGIRASTFAAIVSFYHRGAQACLAFMVIDNYGLDHRKLSQTRTIRQTNSELFQFNTEFPIMEFHVVTRPQYATPTSVLAFPLRQALGVHLDHASAFYPRYCYLFLCLRFRFLVSVIA
jgi:hypothetical protein